MEEDVDLCLEVQVDPASKRILSNPEKCRSALLDVTVVKPKELEALGTQRTNTLRADEVRRLITSLEKQRRKKQKLLDKLKEDDTIIKIRKHDEYSSPRSRKPYTKGRERISSQSPVDDLERKDFIGIAESVEPLFCEIRRSLRNVETRITNMQDINLAISHTTVDESGEEYAFTKNKKRIPRCFQQQSVYRADTGTKDLRSLLCKNKRKLLECSSKIEGKCICENCGLIGFLTDCQKHPLFNELAASPPPSDHTQMLSGKMKTNFTLPKDDTLKNSYNDTYINQLTDRVKLLEERLSAQEEKVVAKDYFKKIISKVINNFSGKSNSDTSMHCLDKTTKKRPNSEKTSPRSTRTQIIKSTHNFNCHATVTSSNKSRKFDKGTTTDDEVLYDGYVWRWGEEILRPGIDLKNRIVTLLTEMMSKLSINDRRNEDPKPTKKYDSETFRAVVKQFQTKVFNTQIDTSSKFSKNHERRPMSSSGYCRDQGKSETHHIQKERSNNVNVSYVNPKLSLWKTESPNLIKADQHVSPVMSIATGREEFLKIISKAKQNQKDILWKNIWNQAKANGQTKEDKITIKIPCQNKDGNQQKLFATELKIGEVEEILKGAN